jgi:inactive dipeptidyl peptidase 10
VNDTVLLGRGAAEISVNFFIQFLFIFSETIPLSPKSDEEWPFLLHAQFTPRGQSIVMVFNYDIYYISSPKASQAYRVTKTAVPGVVSNGVPDWLYEGECL